MHFGHRTLFIALALVAVAGIAVAATHDVSILDNTFTPSNLTINTGDTVTWRNNGFLQHTSTSGIPCRGGNGIWSSPTLNPGQSFSFTFASMGAFDYFCQFHCLLGMTGKVTVTAPVAVETSTWGKIKALYATYQ